jgi:hypothetical protein
MSKSLLSSKSVVPPLDKWKLIQFAELDLFEDSDEVLKRIGMAPLDIRLFREWQENIMGAKSDRAIIFSLPL